MKALVLLLVGLFACVLPSQDRGEKLHELRVRIDRLIAAEKKLQNERERLFREVQLLLSHHEGAGQARPMPPMRGPDWPSEAPARKEIRHEVRKDGAHEVMIEVRERASAQRNAKKAKQEEEECEECEECDECEECEECEEAEEVRAAHKHEHQAAKPAQKAKAAQKAKSSRKAGPAPKAELPQAARFRVVEVPQPPPPPHLLPFSGRAQPAPEPTVIRLRQPEPGKSGTWTEVKKAAPEGTEVRVLRKQATGEATLRRTTTVPQGFDDFGPVTPKTPVKVLEPAKPAAPAKKVIRADVRVEV